jgi:exosortase/archaeosortase family protein
MKKVYSILARYSLLFVAGLGNLWIFYKIFTPLTLYPLYFLFSLFFNTNLSGTVITISNCVPLELINACVAGAAYYLLFILNLSTPSISSKKRILMLGTSFAGLLLINILRIFILGILAVNNSSLFETFHSLFWYLGSTLFVVLIWFLEVKYFDIKNIPLYSDIIYLYKESIKKTNSKNKSKKN